MVKSVSLIIQKSRNVKYMKPIKGTKYKMNYKKILKMSGFKG